MTGSEHDRPHARKRVLWIEDGAAFEAQELPIPVYNSRKYDLVIVLTATDAVETIVQSEFDVVIADTVLEPGEWVVFTRLHKEVIQNRCYPRLGLELLYSLLKPEEAHVKLGRIPAWVKPERFGVLTVETWKELEEHMAKFGITQRVFRQKSAGIPTTALLELIEAVCEQQPSNETGDQPPSNR